MRPAGRTMTTVTLVAMVLGGGALAGTAAAGWGRAAAPCAGASIVGTAGDDVLTGTPGDDVIKGLAGNDTIDGRGGDDVICGGRGTDILRGGEGDDRLFGQRNGLREVEDEAPDNVGDTLAGGPGDDLIDPGFDLRTDGGGGFLGDHVTYADAAGGVVVDLGAGTVTGEGTDTLVWNERFVLEGSPHADDITGTPGDDDVRPGDGDDVVHTLDGNDQVFEATPEDVAAGDDVGGDDVVDGGRGRDYLSTGDGDDTVLGGPGVDLIETFAGHVRVLGGPGDDQIGVDLWADDRPQVVRGGPGRRDHLVFNVRGPDGSYGGVRGTIDQRHGRAVLRADGARHVLDVRSFEDVVMPNGVFAFLGGPHDETVSGGFTDDSRLFARGGGGDDRFDGTSGDDRLTGGPGRDSADGGRGTDRCRTVERARSCER